uniref:Fibronectin type-III domain-containing protein n=1 Tax=Glossina pallidipes TaxID=7398 RepID=A0A1A9ZZ88_GLOPL
MYAQNVIFIKHTVVVVLLLMLLVAVAVAVAVANLCQTSTICNFQYIILDTLENIYTQELICIGSYNHEILNLEPYTQYKVTVQVFNPEGLGPETTILVMTDEGGNEILTLY